ncbi:MULTISPECIES: hypothetical protein [Enterobacteriaceae]|nr:MULTISPECIES: hypothetical protein [Enterobacteriaceae]MBA7878109.1 hypothetical protein [Citrobacter sp. RHBSTW-00827]QLZ81211.1 hypothetical protein HV072_26945 [Citrobacter sp. RHBSTW-00107]UOY58888.1 hypothetical protein LCD48_25745 [Enterobacter asburiae]
MTPALACLNVVIADNPHEENKPHTCDRRDATILSSQLYEETVMKDFHFLYVELLVELLRLVNFLLPLWFGS